MKRMEIGAPATLASLRLVERDVPKPGRGEVLVRVRASSLNFHDYLVAMGIMHADGGRVPLSDGVGEVVELGADARQFRVGDRVMGTFFPDWFEGGPTAANTTRMRGDQVDGFASEYVAMSETSFTPAPSNLSDAEAASLPCAGLTAWRALVVEGGIKPGDTVLVQGTGGVSIFALQFAKMAGARVIATTSSEEKAARVKALGADHIINYTREPKWGDVVHEVSHGGVDHVVEVVGGDLTQSMQACRVGAKLYLVGALSQQPMQFQPISAFKSNARLIALTVGSRKNQLDMNRAIETAGLKPVLDKTFALGELAQAFAHQEAHRHFGKIVIGI